MEREIFTDEKENPINYKQIVTSAIARCSTAHLEKFVTAVSSLGQLLSPYADKEYEQNLEALNCDFKIKYDSITQMTEKAILVMGKMRQKYEFLLSLAKRKGFLE